MPYNPVGLPLEWCSREYRREVGQSGETAATTKVSRTTNTSRSTFQPDDATNPSPGSSSAVLWTPPDADSTPMGLYRLRINKKFGQALKDSHDLHDWTVGNPHAFWIDLYEYCGIVPALPKHTKWAYHPATKLRDMPTFFPGLKLNYAENVLVNATTNPRAVALIGLREAPKGLLDNEEEVTWSELAELVRITRSALVRHGVTSGQVVAALMANSVWTIVLFLACASAGIIFTSVSPDMGVQGCASRFAQVAPKLLFVDVDLAVRGTRRGMMGKVQEILQALQERQSSRSLPSVIFVPTGAAPHLARNVDYIKPLGVSLHTWLQRSRPSDALTFTRLPTSHPLVIVYSSGTTGDPKCIVSPHISLLNYKKVALLHNSLGPDSTVFQYSSTSWILWNVMNGHLSVGAKIICYDGGALYPDPSTLLRICEKYKATYWGTSPRYLLELEQSGIQPSSFDLGRLKLVTTTGATLTGEQFHWFYHAFPNRIHLSSVAGGTDIASSWIATDPAGPVRANEMQMWALGHACDILDETGKSIAMTGRPGELVCRAPFASMPCRFWGDKNHQKYREAYFEKFPVVSDDGKTDYLDVWAQHDFIVMNPATRGVQILGRSDGVLNPSGIRFGSSEIYNIVEGPQFNSVLADTLCVGRRRPTDKDETVFLFVIMAPGHQFGEELVRSIKTAIRSGLSPRHVPKFILPVDDIPYTVNGKKVEIAVKKIISGQDPKISSTVVNPGCLETYKRFRDLERQPTREKM